MSSLMTPARARPALGVAREVLDTRARFERPCPACRRRLRIRVAYAGKFIECRHCRHRFVPDGPPTPASADLFVRITTALIEAGLWDGAAEHLPERPAVA